GVDEVDFVADVRRRRARPGAGLSEAAAVDCLDVFGACREGGVVRSSGAADEVLDEGRLLPAGQRCVRERRTWNAAGRPGCPGRVGRRPLRKEAAPVDAGRCDGRWGRARAETRGVAGSRGALSDVAVELEPEVVDGHGPRNT